MKNFHVWDNEVDKPEAEAGETYQKRVDPLRDFYYLSDEETDDYLRGVAGGSAAAATTRGYTFSAEEQAAIQAAQSEAFGNFAVKDDQGWSDYWSGASPTEAAEYNKRGAYVDQLQDIRQSLEFMQSYRYSEPGSLSSEDFGMNEFEGSREFRKIVNDHDYLGLATWNAKETTCQPGGDCVDTGVYNIKEMNGRLEGQTAEELARSGLTNFQNSAEMRHLTDVYYQQRDLLYKTQKAAGTSMGFNEKYGKALPDYKSTNYTHEEGVFTDPTDAYYPFAAGAYKGLDTNGWALYQDGTWEFGPLDTAAQLHDAIAKIEASGRGEHMGTQHYRNEDQRSYLAQKAYCRYLYSKVNQLGGMDYMKEFGDKQTTIFGSITNRNQDEERYRGTVGSGLEWAADPMYS